MFKFSIRNYYCLVSVLLLSPLIWAWQASSWLPLVFFATFALAGVIGEALFSVWWRAFFSQPFWSYKVEKVMNGYTSWLNFIPWGIGGLLYLHILYVSRLFVKKVPPVVTGPIVEIPFFIIFAFVFLAGLAMQLLIQHSRRPFTHVTLGNYLFFNFPFLLALSVCSLLYGRYFTIVALLFGVIAMVVEYLFGKAAEFFISKKLWVYNFEAMDGGHITLLSILPFSLAGFYFWSIALVVQVFIKSF